MKNLISNEILKLKRQFFLIFAIILTLVPVITGGFGAIISGGKNYYDLFFFINNQYSMFYPMVAFIVVSTLFYIESTHNRRECPVYGHRGGSRGRFYYRITTFEGRPWDARDPHKTTFMTLKHAIRLSIWRKQKETPGVEKAPGVSSPQRKESGRSGRDDGELRFGYDPAIHARRLRVYHRPRRLRMASRISIFFAARRFEPLNSMG